VKLDRVQRALLNLPWLHRKDVARRYGWSLSTLHRELRRGRLPQPVRFSGPLWRLEDLEAAESAGQIRRPNSA
jgi:predicted DNA-binding transcriptional regulator AlpA